MEQDVSTITAGGLVFTLFMGIFLLVLPKRYALVPLFISGCYMTLGQILLIGPLHFPILRLLLIFGWIRIIFRMEIFSIKLNSIDKVLIAWIIISSLLNLILNKWSSAAIIYRLGFLYNTLGIYFLIRAIIGNLDDIAETMKMLGIIIIPLALLFIVEMATGKNIFSIFGGVPDTSMIREGRIRCQGPFRNAILAGTFGATVMPMFVGLWVYSNRYRRFATGAIIAATVIVIASTSSGPLLAYVAAIVGLSLWAIRSKMRLIRWAIVLTLLALHFFMKAPVWFLIARVSDFIGGGGWHRAALIDAAVRHFSEWWLVGTTYTADWMPTGLYINPNMTDITNQFISEGINGGLVAMCLFIWLLVKSFKTTGIIALNEHQFSQPERFMVWSVGCALFGHVASFFSVTYFDQIIIFWYFTIALIAVFAEMNDTDQDYYIAFQLGFNSD